MKRYIKLENVSIKDTVLCASLHNKEGHYFGNDELVAAHCYLSARGIKYDNKTGALSDIEGIISRPANITDHVPCNDVSGVIRDYFAWELRVVAARNRNLVNAAHRPLFKV